jgi:uncharacterized protein YceK
MRAITILTSLLLLSGCATIARSKVGPQVLAAYPYASDASIPAPDRASAIKRRLMSIAARTVRNATRRRRLRDDMDRRATIVDALGTMVPGAAPQIR